LGAANYQLPRHQFNCGGINCGGINCGINCCRQLLTHFHLRHQLLQAITTNDKITAEYEK
jgi:hypothetical protein